MTFPVHFRDHVTPVLRRMCAYYGFCVALGLEGWTDAEHAVAHHAISRGALHLPPALADELIGNWIPTQLLAAITEAEPGIEEHRAIADKVAADLDQHWRAFCAATR